MARLLEDLLDVSRLTRGQFALRRERLALAAVVEHALEIAQPRIDEYRHSLAVSLPERPLVIDGDMTRLAQVFSNLLINAAKYTPADGRLGLTAQAVGDEVEVRVSDNGIGISAEQMPHLFEMFTQGDSAPHAAQGGMGIGLSLARGLVEMHGGRIAACSGGLGLGSEFVVRLPLASPTADSTPASTTGNGADAPATPLRVLVADDLRDSADSLGLVIELMGHQVEVVYDGEAALHAAERLRPDVVLLDLGMPKLDGFAVCRGIRERPWGSPVRLIAQSGWGQEEDRRRTAEAGFDHHIVKPIDPEALEALLRTLAPAVSPPP
jgi:CheY-like chemotaxis protein